MEENNEKENQPGSGPQYDPNPSGGYAQYDQNSSNGYSQYNQDSSNNYPQYNQNPYNGYSQYGQFQRPDNSRSGNGFGIASMILGIISLVLFCTCINIPIAVAAVVFGILQLAKNPENKAMSIVGIATAAFSVLAFIVMAVLLWTPLQTYYRQGLQDHPQSGYEHGYDDDLEDHLEDYFPFWDDPGF